MPIPKKAQNIKEWLSMIQAIRDRVDEDLMYITNYEVCFIDKMEKLLKSGNDLSSNQGKVLEIVWKRTLE